MKKQHRLDNLEQALTNLEQQVQDLQNDLTQTSNQVNYLEDKTDSNQQQLDYNERVLDIQQEAIARLQGLPTNQVDTIYLPSGKLSKYTNYFSLYYYMEVDGKEALHGLDRDATDRKKLDKFIQGYIKQLDYADNHKVRVSKLYSNNGYTYSYSLTGKEAELLHKYHNQLDIETLWHDNQLAGFKLVI